jgi:hypothetical protein
MKIGTLTTGAGVETIIKLNYVPQYLYFVAATALTNVRVSVAGSGIIADLDSDGIKGVSGIRRFGAVANSYLIPLSDGLIPNKVTEIVIVNSASQTPDIYGFSLSTGTSFIVSQRQTVLASSGATFQKFAHLAINASDDTDEITVGFQDGTQQRFAATELKGWYTLYSNETDSFCIDNVESNIVFLRLIPGANRVVVWTKYQDIDDIA